jgi:hypothetical protein
MQTEEQLDYRPLAKLIREFPEQDLEVGDRQMLEYLRSLERLPAERNGDIQRMIQDLFDRGGISGRPGALSNGPHKQAVRALAWIASGAHWKPNGGWNLEALIRSASEELGRITHV